MKHTRSTNRLIAGDTEDIPEMESIKDIDIAFLPCNQPYTMTPEQLARAIIGLFISWSVILYYE